MPDFDNNGATIHYELLGSGAPVLLIAGLASDGASWGPLTPLLAERYRVILVDNRGCGRTRSGGEIGTTDIVADCAALIYHLRLSEIRLVGHSLGGYLALRLAALRPHQVRSVVTLAAGIPGAKQQTLLRDLAELYFATAPQTWFRMLYQWLFSEPFFADPGAVDAAAEASTAYPHRQSPGDFARQVSAVGSAGALDKAAIACPVLSVAAGLDLLAPPDAVKALHAGIQNLAEITIPDVAHSIHWEAPETVAREIIAFLR